MELQLAVWKDWLMDDQMDYRKEHWMEYWMELELVALTDLQMVG